MTRPLLSAGVLAAAVAALTAAPPDGPPPAAPDQEAPDQETLDRLDGPSRVVDDPATALAGPSRAAGAAAAAGLPDRLVLGLRDGRLGVGPDAVPGGLIVTADRDAERVGVAGAAGTELTAASRSLGGPGAAAAADAGPAVAGLDRLLGPAVVRGTALVTPPPGGRLLSGAITVRRRSDDGSPLPAASFTVSRAGRPVATLDLAAGRDRLAWADARGLPAALADGLPPGEYALAGDGLPAQTFTVVDPEEAAWVLEPAAAFAAAVGGDPAAVALFTVEHLLAETDENGRPAPYLADALDRLEAAGETTYARGRAADLLRRLGADGEEADGPADGTGAAAGGADGLRDLIAAGRWARAEERAEELAGSGDARTRAMAEVYRAVAGARRGDSLVYAGDPVAERFRAALADPALRPHDRGRAAVNFANSLTDQVRARSQGYGAQRAAGLDRPLIAALTLWGEADDLYRRAAAEGGDLDAADRAALALNRGRHAAVLADLLHTLGPAAGAGGEIGELADAARRRAAAGAAAALNGPEPDAVAAAEELLAHLALRAGRDAEAADRTERALAAHAAAGRLGGLAGALRTRGILAERAGDGGAAVAALRASAAAADLIRRQTDADATGLARAGLFARYAATVDRLAGLLVDRGEPLEALRVVESAKARGLGDAVGGGAADLDETLDYWPAGTVAVEYHLAADRAFAFLIDADATVTAHVLAGADGEPLRPADLIARVARFLSETEFGARTMRNAALSGRGFDHAWQHTLHRFHRDLMPPEVAAAAAGADRLVVVPHHVLHYFPFAALVTETDDAEVGRFKQPRPAFLVEGPAAIVTAPSLAAYGWLTAGPADCGTAAAAGLPEFDGAPDLPGVATDLANFREVFGAAGVLGRVRDGREGPVGRDDLLALLAEPGLVMLGTHGLNVPDDPLSSLLLCHAVGDAPGRLPASVLYGHDVAAPLVVLSACYTGLADRAPLPGDDLFGVQRALLARGAGTVVAGLWDVYDDTAPALVAGMFRRMTAGDDAAAALAGSQRDFLAAEKARRGLWVHPYFWAVYTCGGGGHARIAR